MKLASMRIPILLAGLGLFLAAPVRAMESIEGLWIGQSGPEDNRATLGLEIKRALDGELTARLFIDLIGINGQPLGAVEQTSAQSYSLPAAEVRLTMSRGLLMVAGFLHDPNATVTFTRAARLPAPAPPPTAPSGPEPRWRARLGGAIFAPVAVYDGIAFVGNMDGVLSAIAIADGKGVWSFAAGRPIFGEVLATIDAIFFVCDNGYLYRLDRGTGKEVWRYDLGDERVRRVLPNPFIYDYDYRAPRPVLAEGVLIVGSGDGSLHAVRADTGGGVWRIAGDKAIRNTVAVAGSRVIFSTEAGVVGAVERSTGKSVWQFEAQAPATAPALVEGKVLVGTRDSMLYALDPADGHVIWSQYWWGSWVESTAVGSHGLAYIGSGDLARVSCIDPASGRIQWRSVVGGWVLESPLITEKFVYVGISGARRSAHFWLPQASALKALDRATGRVIWQWSMPELPGAFLHGFVAAPVIASGTILIGGVDGTLYAFGTDR